MKKVRFLLAAVLAVVLILSAVSVSAVDFVDMPEKDDGEISMFSKYTATRYMVARGLMIGTGDNKFSPDVTLTRAMFCEILYRYEYKYRAFNKYDDYTFDEPFNFGSRISYSDVSESDWYYSSALWAQEKGIMQGYPDGEFKGAKTVTRAEALVILYRYYTELIGSGLSISEEIKNPYSDEVPGWAIEAACVLRNNGIHFVISSGEPLLPDEPVTRAEAACIFCSFITHTEVIKMKRTGTTLKNFDTYWNVKDVGEDIRESHAYSVTLDGLRNDQFEYEVYASIKTSLVGEGYYYPDTFVPLTRTDEESSYFSYSDGGPSGFDVGDVVEVYLFVMAYDKSTGEFRRGDEATVYPIVDLLR